MNFQTAITLLSELGIGIDKGSFTVKWDTVKDGIDLEIRSSRNDWSFVGKIRSHPGGQGV